VLGQHRSVLWIPKQPVGKQDDHILPALERWLRRPGGRALLNELLAERASGSWVRVAVELQYPYPYPSAHRRAASWLPWEQLFEPHRLTVVRRHPVPPWERRRAPLAFPLDVCLLTPAGYLETEFRSEIALGALRISTVRSENIDIAHLACDRLDDCRLSAEEASILYRARVVVIHEQDVARPSASPLISWLLWINVQAILHITGPREACVHTYHNLLRDQPLDMCVRDLRDHAAWGILHCAGETETCVSLSGLLDSAVGNEAEVPLAPTGLPSPSALVTAWTNALQAPFDGTAERARGWRDTLYDASFDASATGAEHLARLQVAIDTATDAQRLRDERTAARRVVQRLDQEPPAVVEAASRRVTEVHVLDSETGAPIESTRALAVGQRYALRMQIVRTAEARAWAATLFPEAVLRETLARLGVIDLAVRFYADPEVVFVGNGPGRFRLPALGDSVPVIAGIIVRRPGPFAVRVCIYHGTALLQSVLLEGTAGEPERSTRPIASRLDYLASDHLMLLDQHEQPDATIWTNEATEGSHWFGVFTGDDPDAAGAVAGTLSVLSTQRLKEVTRLLHEALYQVELDDPSGEPHYRFAPPRLASTEERSERAAQLARLAGRGWDAYTALFNRPTELSPAQPGSRGLLAIAACRPERTNVPWAALYDYPIDRPDPVLCEIAEAELPGEQDLFADPDACREQSRCPLGQPARAGGTVCPFGFWGLRHRIEQPLLHLRAQRHAATALDLDEAPDDVCVPLSYKTLQSEVRLKTAIRTSCQPQLAIACWPHFGREVTDHLRRVAALVSPSTLTSDRSEILRLLEDKNPHIYYFFCHGDITETTFRLRIGPTEHEDMISASDLNHTRYRRGCEDIPPLVFLNGCDTVAFKADTINTLMERFRGMGVSGVIGTEIPVHSHLATDVGQRVLAGFVEGRQLGEVFLAMRRQLVREQLNPLGFAYTLFASARLHLCTGARCPSCTAVGPGTGRS
jgi:hypothetical protein